MNLQSHFILMSKYNQRMNSQMYKVVRELSDFELNSDRGAYFKSIIGTLNHILDRRSDLAYKVLYAF